MSNKQVSPLTLTQIPRWRITRLLEMVQRGYRAEEVETELTTWLTTGIERIPDSFDLPAAAARAVYARSASGESLLGMLPTGEDGRITGRCRDLIESAVYAAIAPHLDQLLEDREDLRAYQPSFGFSESTANPTFETL